MSGESRVFHLTLLGTFRLVAPGGRRIEVTSKKGVALIAMLAMATNGERSRLWLQEKLWDKREAAQASGSLRRELSNLRRCLNTDSIELIVSERGRVRLDLGAVRVDAREPDPRGAASDTGERRDFLEGFDLPEAGEFEDWLREQRAVFARRGAATAVGAPPPQAAASPAAAERQRLDTDDGAGRQAIASAGGASERVIVPAANKTSSPSDPSGERRQITSLFSQFSGIAELSRRADPEDMSAFLQTARRAVVGEIEKLDGFVAQQIGDVVLAHFGYPHAHENDPERAVRAALGVVARVRGLAPLEGVRPTTRIGVATGLVVVDGNAWAGDRNDGPRAPPNFALRLPTLPGPGSIVIDEPTRRHLGNFFDCHEHKVASIDVGAEPTRLWEVHGENRTANRFRALRSSGTPLVGREEEVDLLARRWVCARAGEGRVVLISGEPGIGKSRLADVIRERAGADAHACLEYFCAPHMSESMLFPVLRSLEISAGLEGSDSAADKLQKLENLLGGSSQDVHGDVALFADFLGIPTGERYPKRDLSAQKCKELLLERLYAQLVGLVRTRPVLIIFEDVHWSDPTSREQLDLTIRRIEELPVLLVITHRPNFVPPWLGLQHVSALTLSRLSKRENATMLGRLTGGRRLPKDLADQIVARTDGVPLFVEELTKSVLESGILRQEGDTFVLTDALPALAVPTSLQASLVFRLDRLASVRHVAQIGAALGREFSYEMMAAVSETPDAELRAALDRLVGAELMHRHGEPPDATYRFKHALVQDAAHGTMLRGQRRKVHARITNVLEQSFPEAAARRPDLLAHHATEAGLWEKAVHYRMDAGRMTVTRSAAAEARGHIKKGLALLEHFGDSEIRQSLEYQLQVLEANALMITRGWTSRQVGATLAQLLDHPGREPGSDEDFGSTILLWAHYLFRSELRQASTLVTKAMRDNAADANRSALWHWHRGLTTFNLGDFASAQNDMEYFLRHSYSSDVNIAVTNVFSASTSRMVALCWLGMAQLVSGHADQARRSVEDGLANMRRKPPNSLSRCHLLHSAMYVFGTLGDVDRVAVLAGEAAATAEAEGFVYVTVRCEQQLGWVDTMRGRLAEGVDRLARATAGLRSMSVSAWATYFLALLAAARLRAGDILGADESINEALASIEATDERCFEAEVWRVRGDIKLAAAPDSPAEAETFYRCGLAVGARQGAKLWQLRAATSLARLLASRGDRAAAHALLAPIYESIGGGFDIPDMVAAREVLARATAKRPGGRGTAVRSRGQANR